MWLKWLRSCECMSVLLTSSVACTGLGARLLLLLLLPGSWLWLLLLPLLSPWPLLLLPAVLLAASERLDGWPWSGLGPTARACRRAESSGLGGLSLQCSSRSCKKAVGCMSRNCYVVPW